MSKKTWKVYIIQAQNGRFYTGITTALERRFKEHQKTKKSAKFFRISKPKKIVFFETCKNRSQASIREHEIKRMSRQQKLGLIEQRGTLSIL